MDARAELFPQEYLKKTKEVDKNITKFQNIQSGQSKENYWNYVGDVKGIVAGNFGEVSEDTHVMVIIVFTFNPIWPGGGHIVVNDFLSCNISNCI